MSSIPYDEGLLGPVEQVIVTDKKAQPATETAEETGDEFTIDELSATTRVSSRTIRFYQSKGALPKPTIRGRVAFYTEQHVERLGLIAKLQDQGLRIKAIRDYPRPGGQGRAGHQRVARPKRRTSGPMGRRQAHAAEHRRALRLPR